jgi:hypothetical protein
VRGTIYKIKLEIKKEGERKKGYIVNKETNLYTRKVECVMNKLVN